MENINALHSDRYIFHVHDREHALWLGITGIQRILFTFINGKLRVHCEQGTFTTCEREQKCLYGLSAARYRVFTPVNKTLILS